MKLYEVEDKVIENDYTNTDPYPKYDREKRNEWRKKDRGLQNKFMRDLKSVFSDHGCSKYTAEKMADICWENGHSSGYMDVLHYVNTLEFETFAKEIGRLNDLVAEVAGRD